MRYAKERQHFVVPGEVVCLSSESRDMGRLARLSFPGRSPPFHFLVGVNVTAALPLGISAVPNLSYSVCYTVGEWHSTNPRYDLSFH